MSELAKYPMLDSQIVVVTEDKLYNYAEIMITGIEKNSGSAFANLIRRMAYSHTIGSTVVGIKIKGISSEFDTIPGLSEDTTQLMFNIKNLIIQRNVNLMKNRSELSLKCSKAVPLYASNIICPEGVKILNPEILICTLTEPISFELKIFIDSGTGYFQGSIFEKGMIPFNGSFCPLEHFSYKINSFSHYEDIMIHIRTNGTVEPLSVFYHTLELLYSKIHKLLYIKTECSGVDLNHRHKDFQSNALPTELPKQN